MYANILSIDKELLVNSSALISEHNCSLRIQIYTGDWSFCQLLIIVICMRNNHRGAKRIENRKEDWPWECPFTEEGECRSISAKPTGITKEKETPDCLKIRRNCIKTLDFSFFIYILLLQSYINDFMCSWYISITYHSPVNVNVIATYCIRSTPVYWSTLGPICYGTDTYLPSYSGSEYLFCTRSVATDLVTSLKVQPIRCAIMLCQFGQTRNGCVPTYRILLSSTAANSATGGYEVAPKRFGQSEEPACSNEERTRKSLVLFQKWT